MKQVKEMLLSDSLIRLVVLDTIIDQTLVNSLHGLLNCEIGGLDCHIITKEYRTRVHCIHMYHLFCNALVHVIYSGVSGPMFSYNTKKSISFTLNNYKFMVTVFYFFVSQLQKQ